MRPLKITGFLSLMLLFAGCIDSGLEGDTSQGPESPGTTDETPGSESSAGVNISGRADFAFWTEASGSTVVGGEMAAEFDIESAIENATFLIRVAAIDAFRAMTVLTSPSGEAMGAEMLVGPTGTLQRLEATQLSPGIWKFEIMALSPALNVQWQLELEDSREEY